MSKRQNVSTKSTPTRWVWEKCVKKEKSVKKVEHNELWTFGNWNWWQITLIFAIFAAVELNLEVKLWLIAGGCNAQCDNAAAAPLYSDEGVPHIIGRKRSREGKEKSVDDMTTQVTNVRILTTLPDRQSTYFLLSPRVILFLTSFSIPLSEDVAFLDELSNWFGPSKIIDTIFMICINIWKQTWMYLSDNASFYLSLLLTLNKSIFSQLSRFEILVRYFGWIAIF